LLETFCSRPPAPPRLETLCGAPHCGCASLLVLDVVEAGTALEVVLAGGVLVEVGLADAVLVVVNGVVVLLRFREPEIAEDECTGLLHPCLKKQ
jgi:hypothetical protein